MRKPLIAVLIAATIGCAQIEAQTSDVDLASIINAKAPGAEFTLIVESDGGYTLGVWSHPTISRPTQSVLASWMSDGEAISTAQTSIKDDILVDLGWRIIVDAICAETDCDAEAVWARIEDTF